jgi:L-lactate dehydrogenase
MPSKWNAPARSRLGIVGAGTVGSTIAYAAMLRSVVHEIVLTDVNESKADAEARDLLHGSLFLPAVEVSSGPLTALRDSDVIVITAGARQKPDQTRLDLAAANAAVFSGLVPKLVEIAPDAILLVVSNPVDALTYIAWKLSGLPSSRVFGSGTVLDTSRLRSVLALRLKVAVANVHAMVIGEHGDSEVPLWSTAQIAGVPLEHFSSLNASLLTEADRESIFHGVRAAAAQVIAAKGATNWAVGVAVTRILEAVLRDEQAVLPVSRVLQNYHGISNVCLSVPSLVGNGGVGPALPLLISDEEMAALHASADVVRNVIVDLGF